MYKLGCYNADGSLECLWTTNNKKDAKWWYEQLKKEYHCTIWIQKIEFIDPEELN